MCNLSEKRVRDLNKVLSSKCLKMSTTPANVNGIPLKETGDMCDRNHSINMQLGPWGDLVRDFWDDDDMGEPCPKSIKVSCDGDIVDIFCPLLSLCQYLCREYIFSVPDFSISTFSVLYLFYQ